MTTDQASANREKHIVALSSVGAAIVLTGTKIVVGYSTDSLGILSEAAHSGLDLIAAAVTLWAVRVSARPADSEHTYGHGKFENLSALFETLLLLLTCVWIIYEASQRLFFGEQVEVKANVWAFLVVIVSIVIDFGRSRALMRVAKKYNSQALEADALHFSTDIWSSSVVFVGLIGVLISQQFSIPWLIKADAVAALGVAMIVIWVSFKLGKKSVDDLLDKVPEDVPYLIASAVRDVPGVATVLQTRVRRSGPELFADVTIGVQRSHAFEKSHEIASQAEAAIRKLVPNIDVVMHVEPISQGTEDVLTVVRTLAARFELGAHAIRIYEEDGQRALELHVEVDESLHLDEAHREATKLEQALREAVPGLSRIDTHIEPVGVAGAIRHVHSASEAQVMGILKEYLRTCPIPIRPHNVAVRVAEGELTVSFHCTLAPELPITAAHDLTEGLEKHLRSHMPELRRVLIHVEPPSERRLPG
ncbi:MAG TPA: cation diffusion facilitator family transporter [Planctomycetota bacterium]|jgi:cation diffusion facilitator family transporter